MPLFIGRVWSDGDPFVLLDAADAPAWSPSLDDYEALVDRLSSGKTELAVGDGRAFVLQHEAGEGALEVFREDNRELLAIIARYADEDSGDFTRAAAGMSLGDVGEIEIRTGEVALVRAAVPWAEAGEDESLVVSLPSARYAVREGRLDEEGFGIDVWRIAG